MSSKVENHNANNKEAEILRLDTELREVKAQLQATVKMYETSIEELQVINEELRSTTEELEVSRNELKFVNEDLLVVNRELENKISEISRTSNDLQNLMAATPIVTIILDRQLRIKRYNPAATDIFNIMPADTGRRLTDISNKIDYKNLAADVEQVFDSLNRIEREVAGSDDRYFIASVFPYLSQSNRIDGVFLTFLDIIERRRAEIEKSLLAEQIENQNQRLNNIIANVPGIVWEAWSRADEGIHYVDFVSEYVEQMLGYSVEEWLTTPNFWLSIIHPDDLETALREGAENFKNKRKGAIELRMITKDKRVIWTEMQTQTITDKDDQAIGVRGITIDISGRRQTEEALYESRQQLLQSQKLESVGLLAGGIAHDFNNMLTAINGYSDLTLLRMKEDDPLRQNLEEIKKAGRRSADLTQQLLAFSRRQVLQPVVVSLNEIIASTMTLLQRLIGEDIQLSATLNPKAGRVLVDPGQFSQIIMNLAVNARDAMPRGGKLTIETANVFLADSYTQRHIDVLPGAYVMLAVSDNGSGMNDEIKQHIFDPFFTTKEVGQGTGLGLATVYGIVKQSGGNIEVYSEEGIGTTFKIYLPRAAGEAEEPEVSNNAGEMPKGTETILLVEDEDLVRNLSRIILEECGYTIIEARHGQEALEICEQEDCEFDLLVTDVVMPQMGGQELAKSLTAKLPNLKILFTSGYTDDAIVRHGVIEANTNFIQKPFTPEALATRIREILDNV